VGIRVRLPKALSLRQTDLDDLPVRAPDGPPVPFRRVARLIPLTGQIVRDNDYCDRSLGPSSTQRHVTVNIYPNETFDRNRIIRWRTDMQMSSHFLGYYPGSIVVTAAITSG
jgi:hypothetical protein